MLLLGRRDVDSVCMIAVGEFSELKVKALLPEGVVLGEGPNDVLLPSRWAPAGVLPGQTLRVFVYTDSEDELIATVQTPHATVGQFAFLEVVDVNEHGAFLDWGLEKDLFVPRSLQHQPLQVGRSYVVAVFLDERTRRVAASSSLGGFFDYDLTQLELGQRVNLLVYGFSERGAQVVVDGRYSGLVYASETFTRLDLGDRLEGFVKTIRPDNKLDIALHRVGREAADDAVLLVLEALRAGGGTLKLTDRSPPEEIYAVLGISKKAFKMAVGKLYKARRIALCDSDIRLLGDTAKD